MSFDSWAVNELYQVTLVNFEQIFRLFQKVDEAALDRVLSEQEASWIKDVLYLGVT